MGKVRRRVTQTEHRSSRCQRRRKRTFSGNRFSKSASEVAEDQPPTLDVNIKPGVNTTVNNSSVPVNFPVTIPVTFDVNSDINIASIDNLFDHDHLPGPSSAGDESISVSERKLSCNPIEITEELFCNDYTQFSDNEIMDMGILSEIVACLACPEWKHVGIELLHEKRFGLATKCKMLCGNCMYEKLFWSSQKAESGGAFDINWYNFFYL